jgi:hypothetical protein
MMNLRLPCTSGVNHCSVSFEKTCKALAQFAVAVQDPLSLHIVRNSADSVFERIAEQIFTQEGSCGNKLLSCASSNLVTRITQH